MELLLHNVGIIRNSQVLLDGLTVITGINSSGKTTVGKVVYSLVSAGSNPVEAFEESRRSYICNQLYSVENALHLRRMRRLYYTEKSNTSPQEEILLTLSTHRFTRYNIDELVAFLVATYQFVEALTIEEYEKFFLPGEKSLNVTSASFLKTLSDSFPEWKKRAQQICNNTLELISDAKAFYSFLQDRTSAFLNHEFNQQIKPIRSRNAVSKISLVDQAKTIVSVNIKSKSQFNFSEDSTFLYPYEKCIFIDNPFVIDNLDSFEDEDHYLLLKTSDKEEHGSLITSNDIDSHDEVLIRLLMQSENKNFFNSLDIQKKYSTVFEKINRIVPGEFSKSDNGVFYVEEGAKLSVKNLATGSKMFFIIKKLLLNGLLDETTMLILDEPESHLHPEWINKFAEILVVLIKDIKLNVLLTTHSPNLMLALNVYAKKSGIASNSHFYIAEKMDDNYYSQIRCIDNSIGEGYSHLALPLVEMNLQLDALNAED